MSDITIKSIKEWLAKQPSCAGYPSCDGDLEATEHSETCPMFGKPAGQITRRKS